MFNEERKFIRRERTFGRAILEFKAEVIAGEALDTEVLINGQCLCWITRKDIDAFANDLDDIVQQYQI